MDHIKYRQPLKTGGFHYWGYCLEDPLCFVSPQPDAAASGPSQMFLGVTDRYGTEIYEQDIYHIASNHSYLISYVEKEEIDHELIVASFLLRAEFASFPFDEYAMSTGEVIGNSHENPDLFWQGNG